MADERQEKVYKLIRKITETPITAGIFAILIGMAVFVIGQTLLRPDMARSDAARPVLHDR